MYVSLFSTAFARNSFIFDKHSASYAQDAHRNACRSHPWKVSLYLFTILTETGTFRQNLMTSQYQISWQSVQRFFNWYIQTERTDTTKLIRAFVLLAKAPKIVTASAIVIFMNDFWNHLTCSVKGTSCLTLLGPQKILWVSIWFYSSGKTVQL
jgi:hypothetical protein